MSDLESNIVAMERVKEYSKTETEVGTGKNLGRGGSEITGEGYLVAHHPHTPGPAVRCPFIHSFIYSALIKHQPEVYARKCKGFRVERKRFCPQADSVMGV